jgi:hypothetical protein
MPYVALLTNILKVLNIQDVSGFRILFGKMKFYLVIPIKISYQIILKKYYFNIKSYMTVNFFERSRC